jgi:glucose/mannose-6-phosphate isomerase
MAGGDVLDTDGMFQLAAGLPEQADEAAARSRQVEDLPEADGIDNVVVFGMGGSGIAGDVLLAVAGPFLPIPVVVIKSYTCPAFIGETSLVFAVSCSGDTEETVEAATEAAVNGARIVVVAGDGQLAELAREWGAPIVPVPISIPQPRAALGALAVPPLIVLERLGLFRGASHWIELAVEQLKRRRDVFVDRGESSAPAELARRIGRTIPLIHGGGAVGFTAAQRWKTQINENAKTPAFWSAQPELCHNEVVGWGQHGDVTRQLITQVALRHEAEHPQVSRRFELVSELMREVVAGCEEVWAEGDGELAQLLDLILFGDFTSLWMAAQEGLDPGPVPVLAALKSQLSVR